MQTYFDRTFALTPLDGRNYRKLQNLSNYFSDYILNKTRFTIELRYLHQLSKYKVIRSFSSKEKKLIEMLIKNYSEKDSKQIQSYERITNHDVKAVELHIQELLSKTSLRDVSSMVHFALTSDDINNIAYALMTQKVSEQILIPVIKKIKELLYKKAREYKSFPLLSLTHGQSALPTTLGKEYLVFAKRLKVELALLQESKFFAKLNGNVGNFNSQVFLFPKINWIRFSKDFVSSFGLNADLVTTQIEPYDSYLRFFSILLRINNILKGLSVDMWLYISRGYFLQKKITSEVGSSALPHKINPIYFEGPEGGLGIANSLLTFYIEKLSYSRLQRDLSDSIVRRSWSISFGYSFLSYESLVEALQRIEPNIEKMSEDLSSHYEILSEPIQNFLRTRGYKNAYEETKIFFRGRIVSKNEVSTFIQSLKISDKDKKHLQKLNPAGYTGLAEKLVDQHEE